MTTTETTYPCDGWVVYHRDSAGCPEAHNETGGPWYYQPTDYEGDVYSLGFPTREAAEAACLAWACMDATVGRVGYREPGDEGGTEVAYRRGTTLARAMAGIPAGSEIYLVAFDDRPMWRRQEAK